CILVGVNTVLKDDPRLTSRIKGGRNPLRIILDSKLKTPEYARVLSDSNVVIVTTENHDKKKHEKLREKADIWVLGEHEIDIRRLIECLGEKGYTSLLVEGGGRVNASFLTQKLVDKYCFFFAPKIFLGEGVPVFSGKGVAKADQPPRLRLDDVKKIGEDLLLTAYPEEP
ncbi:MAG: bifunctional diaminohydroxyphosphoribosylaminopyrimidine deaminase/5-amino-6-(5-phosphoribosylamino)uracil reductase, partial [Candidatus Altiarchaeales archaeon]|nr:bifunctional diaminohydroxyphosphoribosylaminopyrimidine deaminase/5-amino-6-(5-phosphoribosylamino)uracil reductase [Candidatus Altiarchaeales archaeon]